MGITQFLALLFFVAIGAFGGYHIGTTPGATFSEKARRYFSFNN